VEIKQESSATTQSTWCVKQAFILTAVSFNIYH